VSHRDNFIFFCVEPFFSGEPLGVDCESDELLVLLSPPMSRLFDAGGPTGTTREPNSTPMVTSWVGENRPSQSRIDNYRKNKLATHVHNLRNVQWLTYAGLARSRITDADELCYVVPW
jgi:hypothetical protein